MYVLSGLGQLVGMIFDLSISVISLGFSGKRVTTTSITVSFNTGNVSMRIYPTVFDCQRRIHLHS